MRHFRVFGIVLLIVMLSQFALAENAPAMYFEPADGIGTYGEETTIDLMVNTSEESGSSYGWIYFDPACVNITDVSYVGSPWQPNELPGWTHYGDYVILSATCSPNAAPGVHKVATLTIDCVGGNCTSALGITKPEPVGVIAYNGTFTCEDGVVDPGKSLVSYTVTVYAGQSTELTINAADFGNMKRGDTSEIIDSLTLTNGGDMDASVDAAFITNVSATYGMVSGINTIPGNNFLLGEDGLEVVLTADGTNVYIGIVPANGAVDYDAILSIPNDAVAGAYTGDVEVTYV